MRRCIWVVINGGWYIIVQKRWTSCRNRREEAETFSNFFPIIFLETCATLSSNLTKMKPWTKENHRLSKNQYNLHNMILVDCSIFHRLISLFEIFLFIFIYLYLKISYRKLKKLFNIIQYYHLSLFESVSSCSRSSMFILQDSIHNMMVERLYRLILSLLLLVICLWFCLMPLHEQKLFIIMNANAFDHHGVIPTQSLEEIVYF